MKNLIYSAFALLFVVAISSCRETTEEKTEEVIEETTSEVEVIETPATDSLETALEGQVVSDSTAVVKEIQ
ncbi:hypothetical protein ATE92_2534 [Ulvibacter sp. MAR_2010_11]|uniref:hypothetical protein n=1 Tax=Ulvibacter sp. MAR_2010_11 TaxID=1250229 RepID=UPI000C2BDADE|nr:hypothetical protein [Ulvibacter sp. MAR_2010_11]PKA84346.1 hypothetical protein ATE92_2534 [Ulvibacter sp. MAR_2010_11]